MAVSTVRAILRILLVAAALAVVPMTSARAQDPAPLLVTAGEVSHDQDTGLVTATDGVEITTGGL